MGYEVELHGRLGRFMRSGVTVAKAGGPLVVPVVEAAVGPSAFVFDPMVVAAGGRQIVGVGRAAVGVVDGVVEVTVDGGHATADKYTGGVAGLDGALLAGSGTSAGDADSNRLTGFGVGDGELPLAGLRFGRLVGDVGDDRSVSGQVTGSVV